jgi:hypothetical protein
MPSSFPRSPRIQKGALAVYPAMTPGTQPSRIIVFQYNPDSMKRTLAARAEESRQDNGRSAAHEDVLRVQGPPVETINLTVELDAADQLENPDEHQAVAEHGLHPALSTLELLMYPSTSDAQEIEEMAARGEVQVAAADLPLVLLVWGKSRVVPVKLTSLSVTEEAFDTRLNPVHAKVDLGFQVLTYMEFPGESIGREAFISYQKQKEELALQHQTDSESERGVRNLLPSSGA